MKRRIAIILLLLAGGAVVNVAVAWGCAYWGAEYVDEYTLEFADEVRTYSGHYSRDLPKPTMREVHTFVGAQHEFLVSDTSLEQTYCGAMIVRMGWPAYSMRSFDLGCITPDGDESRSAFFDRGIEIDGAQPGCWSPVPSRWPPRYLAFRPLWPGFIINTLFYALLLWLLFFAPFAARRMLRRRRGQCEKCAYPIGVSPVCTECGAAVSQKVTAER